MIENMQDMCDVCEKQRGLVERLQNLCLSKRVETAHNLNGNRITQWKPYKEQRFPVDYYTVTPKEVVIDLDFQIWKDMY